MLIKPQNSGLFANFQAHQGQNFIPGHAVLPPGVNWVLARIGDHCSGQNILADLFRADTFHETSLHEWPEQIQRPLFGHG